jgi:hypothetical protein
MNTNEKLNAFANRTIPGAMAVTNVQLTSKPFAETSTRIGELPRFFDSLSAITPLACGPAAARVAVAGDVLVYGADVTAVNDLICPITFNPAAFNGLSDKVLNVMGFFISTKFTNNTVASNFELRTRYFQSLGPGPVVFDFLSFNPIVTPTGGANSASEYIIWCVRPPSTFSYDIANDEYTASEVQRQGFIYPAPFGQIPGAVTQNLGLVESAALIFRGQGLIAQQTTVTPILGTMEARQIVMAAVAKHIG